jgi:hypothetical protein
LACSTTAATARRISAHRGAAEFRRLPLIWLLCISGSGKNQKGKRGMRASPGL